MTEKEKAYYEPLYGQTDHEGNKELQDYGC